MDIQKELIAEYDRETANTRKILEAIPEDADFAWKPHDKSMPLGRLAAHVSDTNGDWALHTLTHDRLDWTPDMNPTDPANKKDLLARFEKQVAEVKPALAAMTPEKWDSNWKFVAGDQTWIDDTQVQRVAHMGGESPDPSPGATWCVPAAAGAEVAGNVWALGRRDVSEYKPAMKF